jgi:hypothetical protein
MKQNKKLLIGYKVLFSLLGFSAIITEIAVIVERGHFNPVNFLSYFTIETNILVAVILLLSAIAIARGKNTKLDVIRSATVVYILVVGLGFSILLAGLENTEFTAVPWDNIVLHYIMPTVMLVDFFIDRPKHRLHFKHSLTWLLFPIVYIAYSLIRGVVTDWYPYPFLNPSLNGYSAVALAIAGMLVLSIGIIWFICRLSGKKPQARSSTL